MKLKFGVYTKKLVTPYQLWRIRGIDFATFYDFLVGIWKYSDRVLFLAFHFIDGS